MMNNTKDNLANNIKLQYKWSNQYQFCKINAKKHNKLLQVFKNKKRFFKKSTR